MTWVKLSDGLYDDPDMEGLSLAAIGCFATVLSYCGKHETDGKITRERALVLARGKPKILQELLTENDRGEAPMITNGAGLLVRNWKKYNPTKEELDQRRREWLNRQHRKRGKPLAGEPEP